MGHKNLFAERKQDSDCCGAQTIPDDGPTQDRTEGAAPTS